MELGPAGWKFSKITTLEIVFVCKFSKIDLCAGWNKGVVQVGFFQNINKLCSTFIR